jgi:hypothetical protein
MLRRRPDVAGEALPVGGRLVRVGEVADRGVAVGGQAGIGPRFHWEEQEQTENHEEVRSVHVAGIPGETALDVKTVETVHL